MVKCVEFLSKIHGVCASRGLKDPGYPAKSSTSLLLTWGTRLECATRLILIVTQTTSTGQPSDGWIVLARASKYQKKFSALTASFRFPSVNFKHLCMEETLELHLWIWIVDRAGIANEDDAGGNVCAPGQG
jgi:hypothetical protein